jgi:hypothetical protein
MNENTRALIEEYRLDYGERIADHNGHWIDSWRIDSPTPGRAYCLCVNCQGTIERREDGTFTGPVAETVCPAHQRALNEQAEGIADYYAGPAETEDSG